MQPHGRWGAFPALLRGKTYSMRKTLVSKGLKMAAGRNSSVDSSSMDTMPKGRNLREPRNYSRVDAIG